MLKKEDIVCISSIDWDFIWQGHQEIMTRLARNGNRVFFIENTGVRTPNLRDIGRIKKRIFNWRTGVHGIRKIEDGLYVFSPIVLPFPYLRIARFINKRIVLSVLMNWLNAVGFSQPIVWTFLPTGLSLDIVNAIAPKVLVYYCIDSFEASSSGASRIKLAERDMIKRSDLVFVTSRELFRHCVEHNKNVHYFPFGVNIDNFSAAAGMAGSMPEDMKGIRRPIAGYVGGIHKWIDFDVLRKAAEDNKDVSFVLCGPVQTDIDKMNGLPNVHFLGMKKTSELPDYIRQFDVALIPYRITEYTKNVYPTKLNEYLAMGKRVISTGLPEVLCFNRENGGVVSIAERPDVFSQMIKAGVRAISSEGEVKNRRDTARKNSWSDRVESMSALIEECVNKRSIEYEASWKKNLLRMYTNAGRRSVPVLAGIALFLLLITRTPLVWLIADPLMIKDSPCKTDLVVALGGGVGESGRAGQGYEERVAEAVKLYEGGFSEKVLFISGYKYLMQEAQVMKALALYMGVPESDILIQEKASSSNDMMASLKEYMQTNGFKSVMIISSPYHMLRLRLLNKKLMPDMRVYYIPIEESSFYGHLNGASLVQVRGIVHEYLAIIYYFFKRYI